MGGAVAVLLIKERHIVAAFERAGATTPERAQTPADLGVDSDRFAWSRLRDRAIVREADAGRFYVDIEVWKATRRMRQRILFVVAAVAVLVALIMTLRR